MRNIKQDIFSISKIAGLRGSGAEEEKRRQAKDIRRVSDEYRTGYQCLF